MRKLAHDRVDRFSRSRIDFFEWAVFKECVDDDFQAAQPMIEDEKTARDHEEHLGQVQIVALRHWNFGFEEMDRFVAEKSNRAAANRGNSGRETK